MLSNAGGEARSIKTSAALRALNLVEAISNCSRLSSFLVQLLRHPSPEVQSKVALLLGRANLNLNRVKNFLSSDDGRMRANVVESLWGYESTAVTDVLRGATNDTSGRASMNALLALCRQGDREAVERIIQSAGSYDVVQRSRAAWAMGEAGNPEFAPTLEKLAADPATRVRKMAQKAQAKLRQPKQQSAPADRVADVVVNDVVVDDGAHGTPPQESPPKG